MVKLSELFSVQMSNYNVFMKTLTVWEGGSESSPTDRCIRDKLNPQDVTGYRGVVGGESTSRETTNQRPSWVAFSYFEEVILAGRPTMQGKLTEENTRPLLRSLHPNYKWPLTSGTRDPNRFFLKNYQASFKHLRTVNDESDWHKW